MHTYETQSHTFGPVYDETSKVLILGSFPSVKSREEGFYYGHPRNRFWPLIARLAGRGLPATVPEKKRFLRECGVALWDVIERCDIVGSSDSSIRNVEPTDIRRILKVCPDLRIFANGNKAGELYRRFQEKAVLRGITVLPSTSPANAAYSMERLEECWSVVKPYLQSAWKS